MTEQTTLGKLSVGDKFYFRGSWNCGSGWYTITDFGAAGISGTVHTKEDPGGHFWDSYVVEEWEKKEAKDG